MALTASQLSAAARGGGSLRDEEVSNGFLSGVGSFLGYVGETLAKPSRAFWSTAEGLTSGDWSGGGLYNLVPFSDTMGLTDPSQMQETADYLENRGVIPENEDGFDRWDIPRFALNVAGDPLSWTTGFGFGKAAARGGQALSKAGVLDDVTRASGMGAREFLSSHTLNDVVPMLTRPQLKEVAKAAKKFGGTKSLRDELLGGQLGFNVPFGNPIKTWGTPEIGRGLDAFGDAAKYSPLGRGVSSLFDHAVRGRVGKAEQKYAREVTRQQDAVAPIVKQAETQAGRIARELLDEFSEHAGDVLYPPGEVDPRYYEEAMRDLMEKETHDYLFKSGDVVMAGDRNNYGWVQRVGHKKSEVLFKNPDTQQPVVKTLDNSLLSPTKFAPGDEKALEFVKLAHSKVLSEIMQHVAETGNSGEAISYFAPDLAGKLPKEFIKKMEGAVAEMQGAQNVLYQQISDLGGNTEFLEASEGRGINHMYRQWVNREKDEVLKAEGKMAPHSFSGQRARDPEIRNVQSRIVTELTSDPRYRGPEAAGKILEDFGEHLDPNWNMEEAMAQTAELEKRLQSNASDTVFNPAALDDPETPAAIEAELEAGLAEIAASSGIEGHAKALADYISDRGAKQLQNVLTSHNEYMNDGYNVLAAYKATHDFLSESARKFTEAPQGIGITVDDVFRRAGMDVDKSVKAFSERFNIPVDDVRKMSVSAADADAVVGLRKKFALLEDTAAGPALKWWDGMTKTFKTYVTVPWPSFLARNHVAGQVVNTTSGYVNSAKDFADYLAAYGGSWKLLRKVQDGVPLEKAEQEILDSIHNFKVFDKTQGFEDAEHFVSGNSWLPEKVLDFKKHSQDARDFMELHPLPLTRKLDEAGVASDTAIGKVVNPVHRKLREIVQTGTAVNQQVEWANRVPMFMYLKKQGYADAAAAKIIEDLHFDYSKLSPMERERFKRAFPFYTFTRKATELVGRELLNRPGGPLAHLIRQSGKLHDPSEGTPEYVSQSTALPIGELADGTKRYLTGFGLAHENPLGLIGVSEGGLDLSGTLAAIGSQMHPIPKSLAEWTFGESLFQRGPTGGRELSDMSPPIGRTISNFKETIGIQEPGQTPKPFISPLFEHIASNTPFTRMLTTASTLLDPRKRQGDYPGVALGTNLLTGLKFTDVSPQQQLRTLEDRYKAIIKEEGGYSKPIVRFSKRSIDTETDPDIKARKKALNKALLEIQKEQRALSESKKVRLQPRSLTP